MNNKYISPEKMSAAQIKAEIKKEYERWEHIKNEGCTDPFWSDGVNLNLVRNHIIYWKKVLQQKEAVPVQISLFGNSDSSMEEIPVPPILSDQYMAPGRKLREH